LTSTIPFQIDFVPSHSIVDSGIFKAMAAICPLRISLTGTFQQ